MFPSLCVIIKLYVNQPTDNTFQGQYYTRHWAQHHGTNATQYKRSTRNIYHHKAIEDEEITTISTIPSQKWEEMHIKTNGQWNVDLNFNLNFNFNFAVFGEQMVTVILLTFKVYKINKKRHIQCCLQWTENHG